MVTTTTQLYFTFCDVPTVPLGLTEPPYQRKSEKGEHIGISPRQGFFLASELRELGFSEDVIDGSIAQWAQQERSWTQRLLGKIGTGHVSVNELQQQNANLLRTALRSKNRQLSPMETLWWLYELDTSALKRRQNIWQRLQEGDRICVDKIHALLGQFRERMPKTYKELKG